MRVFDIIIQINEVIILTIQDRFKRIRKHLNFTQAEFGKKLRLSQNTIANYEIGRRVIPQDIIKFICNEYKISYTWFINGEGEMLSQKDEESLTSSINERVRILRKHLKLTQTEFGKKIGVAGNTITNYENGNRNLSPQTVKLICREFNVSYAWLVGGEGEMYTNVDNIHGKIEQILSGENEFAIAVFKAFAELDEQHWHALNDFIDKINENRKKNKADD